MENKSDSEEGQKGHCIFTLIRHLIHISSLEVENMLKRREMNEQEQHVLFELMTHPDVFPFVRQKATTFDEFMILNKQTIEAEERGDIISRIIVDEWKNPIGTINLFDIQEQCGFLGTWIGKDYHGKGFNTLAKIAFLQELFGERKINTVFMRIRRENIRSRKAAEKLSYAVKANESRSSIFQEVNREGYKYDLYEIPKDLFAMSYLTEENMIH